MVDMNTIILEGAGLYIALAIILFMMISIAALAWSGIKQDEKMQELTNEIRSVERSNTRLIGENWRYRLKYGELDKGTDCHTAYAVRNDNGERIAAPSARNDKSNE